MRLGSLWLLCKDLRGVRAGASCVVRRLWQLPRLGTVVAQTRVLAVDVLRSNQMSDTF